jgi:hypothetical protein
MRAVRDPPNLVDIVREVVPGYPTTYGWPEDISTEDALAKPLELNLRRSG